MKNSIYKILKTASIFATVLAVVFSPFSILFTGSTRDLVHNIIPEVKSSEAAVEVAPAIEEDIISENQDDDEIIITTEELFEILASDSLGLSQRASDSAQLMVKTGPAINDGDFEQGDIVMAFNSKRILNVHAQNITNPKNFGFNEHGRREPGTLLEVYLENSKELKYERINHNEVKRTNLLTGDEDIISSEPNNEGEYMNVPLYIKRRLQSDKHQIFGEFGKEYWYGGKKILTDEKLDKVWEKIEKETGKNKDNFRSYPITEIEKSAYKLIEVENFTDKVRSHLLANDKNTGKRKYKVDLSAIENFPTGQKAHIPNILKDKKDKSTPPGQNKISVLPKWLGIVFKFGSEKIFSKMTGFLIGLPAYAAGTVTTSIGTRAAENIDITSVSGAGPYTVTIAGATSTTDVGDTLNDEAVTPNQYLITAISGTELTVTDSFGDATAPSDAGSSQATTIRTYSTITAWEADLDNVNLYVSSDDAVGEMYNDSEFDESDIVIDGGVTVGLNSIKLTVPVGERHDGTAGTGARIVLSGSAVAHVLRPSPPSAGADKLIIEWLEIDINGQTGAVRGVYTNAALAGRVPVVRYMLIHDAQNTAAGLLAIGNGGRDVLAHNNIIYDYLSISNNRDATGLELDADQSAGGAFNNTIYKMVAHGTGIATGVLVVSDDVDGKIRNNISVGHNTGVGGSSVSFSFGGAINLTSSNNLSDDATSDDGGGSGHVTGAVVSTIFVSTVDGSEDLHLQDADSPAIDAGVDLVTTPTGVNFDIDNNDRDALGVSWDIGADEYLGPLTLTQNDYGWFNNANSVQPGSALASENTRATVTDKTNPLRLRMNITVGGDGLGVGSFIPKLQWSNSTSGPWFDVGSSISSDIWRFNDNPAVTATSSADFSSNLLTNSDVIGKYEERNPGGSNPRSAISGQDVEWDFAIYPIGTDSGSLYYFKIIHSDDTNLDGYNRYPSIRVGALSIPAGGSSPSAGGVSGSVGVSSGGGQGGDSGDSEGGGSGSSGSESGGGQGSGGGGGSPVMFYVYWLDD